MDQSENQNAPAQEGAQRPGRRDMMFCHECADEWYRDERGLTCPECGSDFTEIIEDDNDPRDSVMFGHDGDHDDEPMRDFDEAPPYNQTHHNPWQNDDPEEADISNFNFVRVGPGRFNVQATITRSVSPQGLGAMAPGSIGGFMSMLNGLTRVATQGQGQGQRQGQGEGLFSGEGNPPAYQEAQGHDEPGSPHTHTGRFTYHGGARLAPRVDGPGMRVEPVDDISNVMTGLMAALGAQNMPAGERGGQGQDNVPAPFLNLFQSLGLIPGGGQMGDFVYSQEGLDRIVSQLMEQTASSNAPPPATQADIDALPRKTISEEMLGPEHTAECSICMDEVNIGEVVTELPCKHWFHHQCVSAWLLEHDTCPHCRKGITKRPEGEANAQASTAGAQASSGAQSGLRQMPGAFDDVSGTGTPTDPYVIPTDAGSASQTNDQATSTATDNTAPGGGLGDRIRRGWFGPQS